MRKPTIQDLKLWHVAVAIQYVAGAILMVLPIGFDHPSSLGLDFDDLIVFGLGFAFLTLIAVVCALSEKSIIGLLLATAPIWAPILLDRL